MEGMVGDKRAVQANPLDFDLSGERGGFNYQISKMRSIWVLPGDGLQSIA
jgi:hypothetical protein